MGYFFIVTGVTAVGLNLRRYLVVSAHWFLHTKILAFLQSHFFHIKSGNRLEFLKMHMSDWKQILPFIELWRLYFIFLSQAITLTFIGAFNIVLMVATQRVCWLSDGTRMNFAHIIIFFAASVTILSLSLLVAPIKEMVTGKWEKPMFCGMLEEVKG